MTAGFVTKVLLMVHPFSNSLFTPSLFHTDEYDLEASHPTDSVSSNISVILEADEPTSSLDEARESSLSLDYVMTTEDDSRRAVRYFTSSDSSRESDQIVLNSIPDDLVAHWDRKADLDRAIPDCSIEQKLGEVGVEAQMVIPGEMIWFNSSSADFDPTDSMLPTRLPSDVLSRVDRDRNGVTSLTFQAEYSDPSHHPAIRPAFSLTTSTLQGATESSNPKTESLTAISDHSAPSKGETDRELLNVGLPLFI